MSTPLFKENYYLTDGGLETFLIFHQNITLNYFAAFELLNNSQGRTELKEYYLPYLELAKDTGWSFVAETPTWRASIDWGQKMGYNSNQLFELNKAAVKFLRELSAPSAGEIPDILISGNIGPRGDGYKAGNLMTATEAEAYHLEQVKAFAIADADIITALTINYSNEAIGVVNAARSLHMPVVISFTVETDGNLPDGESLQEAIEKTDAATDGYATHFMINCAHPQHFMHRLEAAQPWEKRIKGIRANASRKSHAELDESTELDAGDKCLLAENYLQLVERLPWLQVFGGCCGTDVSHIGEITKKLRTNYANFQRI